MGDLFAFINKELLPYLHGLDIVREGPNAGQPNPSASPKQRVIGRIMTAVERVRVDSRKPTLPTSSILVIESVSYRRHTLLHAVPGVRTCC